MSVFREYSGGASEVTLASGLEGTEPAHALRREGSKSFVGLQEVSVWCAAGMDDCQFRCGFVAQDHECLEVVRIDGSGPGTFCCQCNEPFQQIWESVRAVRLTCYVGSPPGVVALVFGVVECVPLGLRHPCAFGGSVTDSDGGQQSQSSHCGQGDPRAWLLDSVARALCSSASVGQRC